jgi:arylsulfatase
LSTYNQGMMGFRTPNIDSIANDGMKFTDAYAENSCTAGRSAFITGQSPFRTGLLKVGLPGAKEGLSDKDPTLAELLKPLGYTTGQFGKNHLGDRNEFLPTVHGFELPKPLETGTDHVNAASRNRSLSQVPPDIR